MSPQDTDPLHAAITARLASLVVDPAAPPAWYEAWQALGPDATEAQRLAVYQAIRDDGALPGDASFYLIAWQIDALSSLIAEAALSEMDDELSAIQKAHGLDEEDFWEPGEAPEEYEQLHHRYIEAWNRLFVEQLRLHGEPEMAELFLTDPVGFRQRTERGRGYFHSAADDSAAWLDELAEEVAATMTSESAPGPLGFRHYEDDGCWIVHVYPRPVELVGGAVDGEVVAPGFSLDLEELRALFDRVDACTWQALGWNEDEGPCVLIEGLYQGHEVLLQVLAYRRRTLINDTRRGNAHE